MVRYKFIKRNLDGVVISTEIIDTDMEIVKQLQAEGYVQNGMYPRIYSFPSDALHNYELKAIGEA